MKFGLVYWAIAMAVPALLALWLRGENRKKAAHVLLAVASAFVAFFIFKLVADPSQLGRASAKLGVDQAELPLRINTCIRVGTQMLIKGASSAIGEKPQQATADPEGAARSAETFGNAVKVLETAVNQAPELPLLKAKLIVLLATRNHESDRKELEKLIEQLKSPQPLNASAVMLGSQLEQIYIKKDRAYLSGHVKSIATQLSEQIPPSWYLDSVLSHLYEAAGDKTLLEEHNSALDQRYVQMFVRFMALFLITIFSGFVGLIVLLIQFGHLSRVKSALADAVGVNVPWKSIYIVFIAWFTTQLLGSFSLGEIVKALNLTANRDPLVTATVTASSYLLVNLPALAYIYYFALKGQGLQFMQALNLRWKTSNSGPIRLAFSGYFGWCAALPVVALTAFLANRFLGTQGSENPVLAQVMQAAASPNLLATLLFYLTLGVIAPFCEEILFRGFFYGAFRNKLGVPLSMIASSALFAVMHFDKSGAPMLFAIGMVCAYLYERTRSLIPSIITHGLWNSGTFTMALVLFGTR